MEQPRYTPRYDRRTPRPRLRCTINTVYPQKVETWLPTSLILRTDMMPKACHER